MKTLLLVILIFIFNESMFAQNLWQIKTDSANFAVLISDYVTYEFEKGFFSVHESNTNIENKLPIESIYNPPIDFGDITFLYSVNNDTLFSGEINWQGVGDIIFPGKFIPADSFSFTQPAISEPISFEYFTSTSELDSATLKLKADSAWNSIKSLDVVNEFSQYPYRLGIYLYTPGVGVPVDSTFSDLVNAKWVTFLYVNARETFVDKYLPLKKDNRWLFKYTACSGFLSIESCEEKGEKEVIVEHDSTMSNGKKYFFINGIQLGTYNWVRVDSNWLYVYDTHNSEEISFLNLASEVDSLVYLTDEEHPYTVLIKRDTLSIFGDKSETLNFLYNTGWDYAQSLTLSDKYGLIYVGHQYYGASDKLFIIKMCY